MGPWLHQQAHPHGGNEEQCQDDGNKTEEHNREQKINEGEVSVVTIGGVVGEDVQGLLSHVPQGPSNGNVIDLSVGKATEVEWDSAMHCQRVRAYKQASLHNQHFNKQVK